MTRTVRDTNLDRTTARLRLAVRGKPHWRTLETGLHLGYRRVSKGGGTWLARRLKRDAKVKAGYAEAKLGTADDLQEADGLAVLSFGQAQQAARAWWKAELRRDDGLAPDLGPYNVAQALDDYFAHREQKGSKGVKADRYAARARIAPNLGAVEVAKLTAKRIKDWHAGLASAARLVRTKRFAPQAVAPVNADDPEKVRARKATANRLLTILKAALNYAYSEGSAPADDAWRKALPFREVDAARVRYLSAAECVRLVNACAPDFRDLVRGALMTGCRYGELVRMTVNDFNADAGSVHVRLSKSGRARHVALNDEGRAFFASHCAGRPGKALVFARADGKAWGASHQARPLLAASHRAGIDPAVSFHILRHTYASALAMRGVPMGVIAAQLGHADTRMTERHYAHISPGFVADTIRAALPGFGITDASNVTPMARKASGALTG